MEEHENLFALNLLYKGVKEGQVNETMTDRNGEKINSIMEGVSIIKKLILHDEMELTSLSVFTKRVGGKGISGMGKLLSGLYHYCYGKERKLPPLLFAG